MCKNKKYSQHIHYNMLYAFHSSFGKHSHDEMSILVPLTQCCRYSKVLFCVFTALKLDVSVTLAPLPCCSLSAG